MRPSKTVPSVPVGVMVVWPVEVPASPVLTQEALRAVWFARVEAQGVLAWGLDRLVVEALVPVLLVLAKVRGLAV